MVDDTNEDFRGDPEFMTSLARGLAVLRCFSDRTGPLSIAEAVRKTGFSRPAVRRCLYTLVQLGYAAQVGPNYVLQPKILSLGYSYLSSSSLPLRAQPLLDSLRDEVGESCSLGVEEDGYLRYVARAESTRIMAISLRPGSRLPLYATSMGRVLLAAHPRDEQERMLRKGPLAAMTAQTITNPTILLDVLTKVTDQGYAIVDQELDLGLRSVAVPIHQRGRIIAAVNIGMQSARVPMAEVHSRLLPALRRMAAELEATGPASTT